MCGIAGFVSEKATEYDLFKMGDCIAHRGPDSRGHFYDPDIGLTHTRLSIIDLSTAANQPYHFEQLILIFNGEIYNYQEIQKFLINKGYDFVTNSDTEVVIKAFHCWGEKAVDHFVGMFAFALYDKNEKQLFLFRDRLGVKPLYFYQKNGELLFASELKAIKAVRNLSVGQHGLNDFLRFGYTISEHSIFQEINKLKPGHFMKYNIQTQSYVINCYWSPEEFLLDPLDVTSEEKLIDELEETLVSAFKYRMVADVPVGVFFSGGIDSSLVAAILSQHHGDINTFTIGFDTKVKGYNEADYARKIAGYLGTNHTEKILTISKARERLNEFYNIYEEPFYDSSGIPTSLVSQLAKENGMKVVLSADGGDELFGGYSHYNTLSKFGGYLNNVPEKIRQISGNAIGPIAKMGANLSVLNLGNKMSRVVENLHANSWQELYEANIVTLSKSNLKKFAGKFTDSTPSYDRTIANLDPIRQFMLWDLKYFLPDDLLVKIDRATMYHGIEGREPFLDHRLVELALRIPINYHMKGGSEKYLLKKVLSRYVPNKLFERPKQGFSIPMFEWFKNDLDAMFTQYLTKDRFSPYHQYVDYSLVEKEIKLYNYSKKVNKERNILMIWKLLSFTMWSEKWGVE